LVDGFLIRKQRKQVNGENTKYMSTSALYCILGTATV